MTEFRDVLRERFGFSTFRPGQEAVIQHLLAGHSAAAVFPTGSGKSLCYQLPALMLEGLTLVVSPLIALMKDQLDKLEQLGIPSARLDSTLDAQQSAEVMARIRARQLKLLYVAPERFNNERFRESMKHVHIALFAVDEAHCISEWGHNFRPDYLKLATYAADFKAERVLALTATATPQVLTDICKGLSIRPEHAVRTGFYRPNLELVFEPSSSQHRNDDLVDAIHSRPLGSTVVYVTTQKRAMDVATILIQKGYEAKPYHAGLKDDVRAETQDWFLASDTGIVVATIAFGMGIDKPNIRYVYHYNLPKSLENYSQEIGRAGRDGLPAVCEMLLDLDDLNVLENFVYGDTPSRESIAAFVDAVFDQTDEDFDVSLYELSFETDIKPIVLKTLLTYLELDGYLKEGTPFYSTYQFKPLVTSKEILAQFEGERQAFLKSVFQCAKKGTTWLTLDLHVAAQQLNQPRDRIVKALDYCSEKQWLEVKVEGVRNRFKRLRALDDRQALIDTLFARALTRERNEIQRLQQVVDLAQLETCQVNALCQHFGETLPAACGHCSACLAGEGFELAPRSAKAITDRDWSQALAAQRDNPVLKDTRAFARFLCGLTSPKLTRARLGGHPMFARFEEVPFATVLQRAQAAK